ncbi:putative glycoside hydrolase [Aeromonas sp. QDB25]|uniref:putative glycoside hydrolase n=1 Tax=Aeromonas sp. QDB25 TaxID=2989832 RepID=UPI0022E6D3DB|nr:putative glycoside hydrolase [Aeromonas sp. QDB25]
MQVIKLSKLTFLATLLGLSYVSSATAKAECPNLSDSTKLIRVDKSIRLGGYFYAGTIDTSWYAKNFDLLDLNAKNNISLVYALKAKNKNMIVYQQFLMNQMATRQNGAQVVEGYNPSKMSSWLLRDEAGIPVASHRGPNYHFMDVEGKSGWSAYFAKYVSNVVDRTGADGVVLDEIPLIASDQFDSLLNYPSSSSLQNGAVYFLDTIRSKMDIPVLINAGQLHKEDENGNLLWKVLGEHIDGAWHEGWVVYYGAPQSPHEGDMWEADISSAEEFSRLGKPYIASAMFSNAKQLEYGLSNYLLAIQGSSLVFQPMVAYDPETRGGFNFNLVKNAVEKNRPLFDVELGCPVESRKQEAGVWTRKFDRGMVVVNPTTSKVQVGLSRSYKDVYGNQLSDSIQLERFSGKILLY